MCALFNLAFPQGVPCPPSLLGSDLPNRLILEKTFPT